MHWLDRDEYKDQFHNMLEDSNFLTLNASCDTEIEDIVKYFKHHLNNFNIGVAVLNSSLVNKKYDLLEALAYDFGKGNKAKFINFYTLSSNLSKTDNISSTLQVGKDIKANHVEMSDIKVNVFQSPDLDPIDVLQEKYANEFLDKFIEDIKKFSYTESFLLIIKLLEDGFSKLSKELRIWFKERFIKRIIEIENVKVVLLYHDKQNILKSEKHIDIFDEKVSYNDIYKIIKESIEFEYGCDIEKLTVELMSSDCVNITSNSKDSYNQLYKIIEKHKENDVKKVINEVTKMLVSTDGIVSSSVYYNEASRTYHTYCDSGSNHDKICHRR